MLVNFQTDCWAGPNTGKLTWVNFLPTLKNRILKMATPGSLACFLSTPRLSRRLVISYSMYVWIILREGSRHDVRVWHSWKGHKWISEYIRIKKFTRTNIRIYSYQQIWHEQMPELVFVLKIVWIFEYSSSVYTDQRMSEYICANKFDTNECANIFIIFLCEQMSEYIFLTNIFEYLNIRIYSSHSGPHQSFLPLTCHIPGGWDGWWMWINYHSSILDSTFGNCGCICAL